MSAPNDNEGGPRPPSRRLVPEAVGFQTRAFSLPHDLDHLASAYGAGLPEATVLYCARILDALAAQAIVRVYLDPSESVFSNLLWLERLNLIAQETLYFAHGLRRVGNDVRHINRRVAAGDAEVAVAFLQPCLDWFFRRFRLGDQVPRVFLDDRPLGLPINPDLHRIIDAFTTSGVEDPLALLAEVETTLREAVAATPVIPALLAELVLGRGRVADALHTVEEALRHFPVDLRLRQLRCLCWRRTGVVEDLERAVEELRALKQDEETVGILAATYKALWQARGASEPLQESHRLYKSAWKDSKRCNTWLGINAATTALWLGRPAEARRLAKEVGDRLQATADKLEGHCPDPYVMLNYWDQVTRAEVELLLGELARARSIYLDAFAMYSDRVGDIRGTRDQAERILPGLGLTCSGAEFFGAPGRVASGAIVVGVTGHRKLPDSPDLARQVLAALDLIRGMTTEDAVQTSPAPLVALSSLAEGADRLVAEAVLAPGGGLRVVLPLEVDDYLEDFDSESSREDFRRLLNRADAVTIVAPPVHDKRKRRQPPSAPDTDPREAAYRAAGQRVVDGCDVLLAVWDGGPPAGPGGTADIVAYARAKECPIVWIQTIPPFEILTERCDQLATTPPQQGDTDVYLPDPIDTSQIALPEDLLALVERLAENSHDVWARQRLAEGWVYGPKRDDDRKQHPDLVPYAQLAESEKVYDRQAAVEAIKAIIALGYQVTRG